MTDADQGDKPDKDLGGRPTKYGPEILEKLETLGHKGESVAEACVELGIVKTTWYQWINPKSPYYKEEFSHSVEGFLTRAEAFMIKLGMDNIMDRSAITGEKINTKMFEMNMQNRFGWNRKSEVEESRTLNITIEGEDADL